MRNGVDDSGIEWNNKANDWSHVSRLRCEFCDGDGRILCEDCEIMDVCDHDRNEHDCPTCDECNGRRRDDGE